MSGNFLLACRASCVRTEKPILRKREIFALLKISNQAFSLDSWSHWTWLRPFKSSPPRESVMPLKWCQKSTVDIPGLGFLWDLLISENFSILISTARNAHLRRLPEQAMESSLSGDAFSFISRGKTPWFAFKVLFLTKICRKSIETAGFEYISGSTRFRAVSRQALESPASVDHSRPLEAARFHCHVQTSSFHYGWVQNDIYSYLKENLNSATPDMTTSLSIIHRKNSNSHLQA